MKVNIEIPANCLNCGHREVDMCLVSGYEYLEERRNPTKCSVNFDKWTLRPKRKGFLVRLIKSLFIVSSLLLILTSCSATKQQHRTVDETVRNF